MLCPIWMIYVFICLKLTKTVNKQIKVADFLTKSRTRSLEKAIQEFPVFLYLTNLNWTIEVWFPVGEEIFS
jgi:hypothetical protein